jgi:hypothetical protein
LLVAEVFLDAQSPFVVVAHVKATTGMGLAALPTISIIGMLPSDITQPT